MNAVLLGSAPRARSPVPQREVSGKFVLSSTFLVPERLQATSQVL